MSQVIGEENLCAVLRDRDPCACLPVYLSIYVPVCLPVYLSTCLSIHLLVYLPVSLSTVVVSTVTR